MRLVRASNNESRLRRSRHGGTLLQIWRDVLHRALDIEFLLADGSDVMHRIASGLDTRQRD